MEEEGVAVEWVKEFLPQGRGGGVSGGKDRGGG